VQVDPIKTKLKAPGTKRLKLKYDELLSNSLSNSTCATTQWAMAMNLIVHRIEEGAYVAGQRSLTPG
jgi:hypothetical protein